MDRRHFSSVVIRQSRSTRSHTETNEARSHFSTQMRFREALSTILTRSQFSTTLPFAASVLLKRLFLQSWHVAIFNHTFAKVKVKKKSTSYTTTKAYRKIASHLIKINCVQCTQNNQLFLTPPPLSPFLPHTISCLPFPMLVLFCCYWWCRLPSSPPPPLPSLLQWVVWSPRFFGG